MPTIGIQKLAEMVKSELQRLMEHLQCVPARPGSSFMVLLEQVVANGSCHSIEGIKLEELGLKTGEAKLLVRGSLLGAAQDASIILTDFPVAVLQPFFRALPALEHAMPAVAASGTDVLLEIQRLGFLITGVGYINNWYQQPFKKIKAG